MEFQTQSYRIGQSIEVAFKGATAAPPAELQSNRMQGAAATARLVPLDSSPPEKKKASVPKQDTHPPVGKKETKGMIQSAKKGVALVRQSPLSWMKTHFSSSPSIATYQKHELVQINKNLELNLSDSQLQRIATVLQNASEEMKNAKTAPQSIKIDPGRTDDLRPRTVVLQIRQEGIKLEVKSLGSGAYKSTKAALKLAKLVQPHTAHQEMKEPAFARLKAEGIMQKIPSSAGEIKELENEIRIDKRIFAGAKEASKRGDDSYSHIASIKCFTYASTGEQGFRSEMATGDLMRGNPHFTDKQRLQAAACCCKGTAQLHTLGIVHRDIKSDNFLYWKDAEGNITAKVADMGKAIDLKDPKSVAGDITAFALKYIPPDMALDQKAWKGNPARDDFAMGIMLLELFSGKTFDYNSDPYVTFRNQFNFIRDPYLEAGIPGDVNLVIKGLLANSSYGCFDEQREAIKSPIHSIEKITSAEAYKKLEVILAKLPDRPQGTEKAFQQASQAKSGYAAVVLDDPQAHLGYDPISPIGSSSPPQSGYAPLNPPEPAPSPPPSGYGNLGLNE